MYSEVQLFWGELIENYKIVCGEYGRLVAPSLPLSKFTNNYKSIEHLD